MFDTTSLWSAFLFAIVIRCIYIELYSIYVDYSRRLSGLTACIQNDFVIYINLTVCCWLTAELIVTSYEQKTENTEIPTTAATSH